MNGSPLFSVVIPAYNKEAYIRDTITSVLSQTCSLYEVVMVGGSSSDQTDVICQEFTEKYPDKFLFVIQSGAGAAHARNDGILAARGEYVAFLDADDIWLPEYLEIMGRLISDFPEAIMYASNLLRRYPNGLVVGPPDTWTRGYIDYFQKASWTILRTSALIADKRVLIELGLFKTDYMIGEDVDLMTRMALNGKVAYEPKLLGTYLAELPESLYMYRRGFPVLVPGEPELYAIERIPQIVKWHEKRILATVLENLDRGNHKEAREQLNRIHIIETKKVQLCWILSYLPTPIFVWIHVFYDKHVWQKKR